MAKMSDPRQIDSLGRIVLPKKMREELSIKEGDFVTITLQKNSIVIKRAAPVCVLCESSNSLVKYEENYVCKKCISKLAENL